MALKSYGNPECDVPESGQGIYCIGDRVIIDWFQTGAGGGTLHWLKGFITDVFGDGAYAAIREEDLQQEHFSSESLRHVELDAEGFVSAAGLGFMTTVKKWVGAGNDVNVVCDGFTALYLACDEGRYEVVKYLIEECEAEPDISNAYGVKAFDLAFMSAQRAIINYAVQRQVNAFCSTNRQSSKAAHLKHFLSKVFPFCADIQRKGAKFIRVLDFLELETRCIDTFIKCQNLGLHISSKEVAPNSEILFISHGWEQQNSPSPSWEHYSAIKKYLRRNKTVQYLWIDFMCLGSSPKSETSRQMASTISALFHSTHFLIVPKTGLLEISSPKKKFKISKRMTNIRNYMMQAWGMFELLVAMLAGCTIHCFVVLDEILDEFIPVAPIINHSGAECEQSASQFALEFQASIKQALQDKMTDENRIWVEAVVANIIENLPDPLAKISDLAYVVMSISESPKLLMKLLTAQLKMTDLARMNVNILSGPCSLEKFAQSLGQLKVEADSLIVLRGLLLVMGYSMDKLPATPSNSTSPLNRPHHRRSSYREYALDGGKGPMPSENETQASVCTKPSQSFMSSDEIEIGLPLELQRMDQILTIATEKLDNLQQMIEDDSAKDHLEFNDPSVLWDHVHGAMYHNLMSESMITIPSTSAKKRPRKSLEPSISETKLQPRPSMMASMRMERGASDDDQRNKQTTKRNPNSQLSGGPTPPKRIESFFRSQKMEQFGREDDPPCLDCPTVCGCRFNGIWA